MTSNCNSIANKNTAVITFGRMNPPTVGHKRLVEKITSIDGDHYVFLSHKQHPKTDPLDYHTKQKFVKIFFPDVTVGDHSVKTVIQALQKINDLGYDKLVFVTGSDRLHDFKSLLTKYNQKEYNFSNIEFISAGTRDPDGDAVTSMSASKMREAAKNADIVKFFQGVPDKKFAKKLFEEVRNGMRLGDLTEEQYKKIVDRVFDLSDDQKDYLVECLVKNKTRNYLDEVLTTLDEHVETDDRKSVGCHANIISRWYQGINTKELEKLYLDLKYEEQHGSK